MEFLFTPTRLRSLTRAAHQIPPTRSISTSINRPRALPFFPPPPARRNFERTPLGPQADADKDKRTRSKIERRPTNRQIPFRHVFVIDPETNKLSRAKQSLGALLETWSKQGQVIELVASTPEPIVRVTTRSEVEAQYKEMKRALRKGAKVGEEPKEVRLTWGIAKADLEHKLRKAKRDLERGYRVVVMVAMKKRNRPSNRQELVVFADEISEVLSEVGEEWKEREFTERLMTISFRKAELEDDVPNDNLGDIYST